MNTNFRGGKKPNNYMIILGSVSRANRKCHPQTLLEECKYTIKINKMRNLINDDLDPSSSDESENESV